ncbi:MAG: AprI/Inh family metalloprotease inhibitor [Methylobacterium frigidaeris]
MPAHRLVPLIGLLLWAWPVPAQEAGPPRDAATAAGAWDLSLTGSYRRCVLTLAPEEAGPGRILRFPAGCRRALPLLNGLAGWRYEDGAIQFVDHEANPVLEFPVPDKPGPLAGQTASGERYALAAMGRGPAEGAPPAIVPVALPAAGGPAGHGAVAPRDAGAVAGTYTLDRFVEKDVCRLSLADGAVQVLEGCRDGGLATFDPASWRYEAGRLTLVARRGHSVELIPTGDGRWRRDPEIGTTFVLRRVTP